VRAAKLTKIWGPNAFKLPRPRDREPSTERAEICSQSTGSSSAKTAKTFRPKKADNPSDSSGDK
jgi:hypothetical protein